MNQGKRKFQLIYDLMNKDGRTNVPEYILEDLSDFNIKLKQSVEYTLINKL